MLCTIVHGVAILYEVIKVSMMYPRFNEVEVWQQVRELSIYGVDKSDWSGYGITSERGV